MPNRSPVKSLSEHYKVKTVACAQCPIACEQMSLVREGPYTGAITGIEYESLYATGSNCGISDMKAIIKMVDVCDEAGMDSMSGGVTVSWVMETFEKGIFKKEDFKCKKYPEGFEPNFGNGEAGVTLLEMIRDREGIGNLLAEGTRIAAATIDKERKTETYKWAMNSKGLECPGYDARGLKTFAVGAAVGTRGGCHNRSAAYDMDITGGQIVSKSMINMASTPAKLKSTQRFMIRCRCANSSAAVLPGKQTDLEHGLPSPH